MGLAADFAAHFDEQIGLAQAAGAAAARQHGDQPAAFGQLRRQGRGRLGHAAVQ